MQLRLHTIVIGPLPPAPGGAVGNTRSVATSHGFRFSHVALIDRVVRAAHAAASIDEPAYDDAMSLVGAELVVPFTVAPTTGRAFLLFGRRVSPNSVFGLWGLPAWTHRANPSAWYASWTPRHVERSTIHRRPRVASGGFR